MIAGVNQVKSISDLLLELGSELRALSERAGKDQAVSVAHRASRLSWRHPGAVASRTRTTRAIRRHLHS